MLDTGHIAAQSKSQLGIPRFKLSKHVPMHVEID
jgi:hypothetical protein